MSTNEPGVVEKVAARITVDISPWQQKLNDAASAYEDFNAKIAGSADALQKALSTGPKSGGNTYLQGTDGTMRTVRQQIAELQTSFKEGTLSAQELFTKLQELRTTYASAFDMNTSTGLANDIALRNSISSAETQVTKFNDFQYQSEIDINQRKQAADQAYMDWWESALNKQTDDKVKQVKLLHDTQIQSAQDSLDQLTQIYTEDYTRFASDVDKKMQALKQMSAYEKEAFAAANAPAMSSGTRSSGSTSGSTGSGGLHIGVTGMAAMMAEFTGISMLMQNVRTGLVDITKQQQGLEQVFGQNISSQQQLNQVTNDFIGIAEKYGASVTDVLDAAKQWGRQYHDVATAQALVNSSTLLSIVDNMNMTDSAKALEATMNAMGMSVKNAADAQASSIAIVDQWSNMAHNASVSANDLASGVQVAAGAAHQAGMNLAQLNALIAAGVRNSGLSGTNIGNMFKTVLANISADTPKIQKAFDALGISMTQLGSDGQQHMKPVYDLLVEMSSKSQNLDAAQKQAMLTITRGVQQYSKFAEAISNVNTIQQDYAIATNSAGAASKYAQEQLHTLSAELTRLHDEIQQMAYNAGSGGLGDVLTTMVRGVTDLIAGLQKLPAGLDYTAAGFVGVLIAVKGLTGVMNTVKNLSTLVSSGIEFWGKAMSGVVASAVQLSGSTVAFTADLNAKVIATEADTAAMEAQTVAAGEVIGALEAETVEVETATEAWLSLDTVSGGIAIALGVATLAIAGTAVYLGSMQNATASTTQSVQDLTKAIDQQTQSDMQNAQQAESNLSQLEQLKQQYLNATDALKTSKQGSDQYKQAQVDLINVQQQLDQIIGKSATDRIKASTDISKAFDNEAKAMIQAQITELQVAESRTAQEQALTSTVVQETSKRIAAYQTEANAAQAAQQYMDTGPMTRFGMDRSGGVLGSQPNAYDATMQANQTNIMRASQLDRQAKQRAIQDYQSSNNSYNQQIAKLQLLMSNPSLVSGDAGAVVGGSSAGKGAGSALSQYMSPYQNLTQSDTISLQDYTNRIKAMSDAYSVGNKQMTTQLSVLKQQKTSTQDVTGVMKLWDSQVVDLRQHQQALTDENAKINQMLPQIKRDMADVNAQYANGSITAQEHRDAISNLNSEYQRLTDTLTQNKTAMADDLQKMIDVSNQVNQWNFDNANNGITTMKDNIKSLINGEISQLDAQISGIDQQLNDLQWNNQTQTNQDKMTKLQQEAAQWKDSTSVSGRTKYEDYLNQISDLQTQMNYDNAKHALDTQKQNLQDQKTALQQHLSDLQGIYSGFSDNVQSITQALQLTIQAQAKETNKVVGGYLGEIASQLQTLQSQFISVGSTGATTVGSGTSSGGLNSYWQGVKSTGGQYGDPAAQGLTTAQSIAQQAVKYGISPSQIQVEKNAAGQTRTFVPWQAISNYANKQSSVHMATGGQVPLNMGIRGVDSIPAMLTPGEVVIPHLSWENLSKGFRGPGTQHVTNVRISLEGAFDGATFRNREDVAYGVNQLSVSLERGLAARLRSQGIRG